jgi:small subunit ribosomal protein S10e
LYTNNDSFDLTKLISLLIILCDKDKDQKHEVVDINNYHCFLVMRSLNSRKYVSEIFNWQWHYYFLKPEGIKFLRNYLGLPDSVIPNTHKQDVSKTEEVQDDQKVEDGQERNADSGRGRGRGRGRGGRGRGQ